MVCVKYLIIPLIISLNCNLVVGGAILTSILQKILSLFGFHNYQNADVTIPSPFPILELVTATSVCGNPPPTCPKTRYRAINGSCNNLENPGWGTPNTTFGRILKSNCGDDGELTAYASNTTICAAIIIPDNDPIHKKGSCLDFERTITARDIGCAPSDKPGEQLTLVTTFMDASILYGSTDEESAALRTLDKGLMKTVKNNSKEWPPQNPDVAGSCPAAQSPTETCFLGGDRRINQNTQLTLLHIILLRYHNVLATKMYEENPKWSDERMFQEVRRIVIGCLQNINFYEYFPLYINEEILLDNNITYERNESNMEVYINDHNSTVNPTTLNEFTAAAFRYFHSLIRGFLQLLSEHRVPVGNLRLSDWFNKPSVLEEDDNDDKLVRGFTNQAASGSDRYFDAEITSYLLRGTSEYGSDLRAIDIQRDRDHCLGNYVSARAACGLSVPKSFDDLCGIMYDEDIEKIVKLYDKVEDIDLTVGGSLEIHVKGSLVGPVFCCLIVQQLHQTRCGDRFFFENGLDKDTRFEPAQLKSIRSVTIASVLCATTNIKFIQKNAFEQVSFSNPLVSCDDIPKINITLWKEKEEEANYP